MIIETKIPTRERAIIGNEDYIISIEKLTIWTNDGYYAKNRCHEYILPVPTEPSDREDEVERLLCISEIVKKAARKNSPIKILIGDEEEPMFEKDKAPKCWEILSDIIDTRDKNKKEN